MPMDSSLFCIDNCYCIGGRPTIMNSNMGRGGSMKRPATMPVRHALPPKRATPMDRLVTYYLDFF